MTLQIAVADPYCTTAAARGSHGSDTAGHYELKAEPHMSKYLSAEELALATGPGGTILLIISETDDTILHPPGSAKVSFLQCVPLAAMRGAGSNHLNSMAKHEKYKNDSHRPLGSETSMMEASTRSSPPTHGSARGSSATERPSDSRKSKPMPSPRAPFVSRCCHLRSSTAT